MYFTMNDIQYYPVCLRAVSVQIRVVVTG